MTVYLLINTRKAAALAVARRAGEVLLGGGAKLLLDETARHLLQQGLVATVLPEREACTACDVVVTVGGDGTMLHAARYAMQYQKPLLGVNIGRLGFLTVVEGDETDKLARLAAGQYIVERRMVLQAGTGPHSEPCLALNDIVLFKDMPERTVALDIYCDDILVSRFRGDGIIFATPTGSTAYSMSAGGPILDARLEGVVVTQICAHIVHTPPMVVAAGRTLRAVPTPGMEEERVVIICDGRRERTLEPGQAVEIGRSEWQVPLIQFADAQQLESIDKKLKGR